MDIKVKICGFESVTLSEPGPINLRYDANTGQQTSFKVTDKFISDKSACPLVKYELLRIAEDGTLKNFDGT
jgi:hypothetical protein